MKGNRQISLLINKDKSSEIHIGESMSSDYEKR